jgi:hypothetical protein
MVKKSEKLFGFILNIKRMVNSTGKKHEDHGDPVDQKRNFIPHGAFRSSIH